MTRRIVRTRLRQAGLFGLLISGCATVSAPRELAEARQSYLHAQASQGATLVPAELHKAKVALDEAERAFTRSSDAPDTLDLAYVAERRARLAEALGMTEEARLQKEQAAKEAQRTQERMAQNTLGELQTTKQRLDAQKREVEKKEAALDRTTEQLKASEAARRDAEQKAEIALKDLAAINAIKEDERGMVITIPGSVLFASGQWILLPSAQQRLDQVAEALASRRENLVVEGHTDDRGPDGMNQELSQKRAQTVCSYLVTKGVPADRCQAMGYGKSRPLADNRSAEGRANNRRVEIVVPRARLSDRPATSF